MTVRSRLSSRRPERRWDASCLVSRCHKLIKLTAALVIAFPSSAVPKAHMAVQGVAIGSHGIYEVAIVGTVDDRHLLGGVRNIVRRVKHLKDTTVIPALRCVTFGFEYFIHGSPSGVDIPIRMVTRFPEHGLRNPETGETTHRSETVLLRTLGQRHFRGYTLQRPWEVVFGTWTFELWHNNRKLAEQRFQLADPCQRGCQDKATPEEVDCENDLIGTAPSSAPNRGG